ncbi:MAG: transposase [Cocleimonas sp.]
MNSIDEHNNNKQGHGKLRFKQLQDWELEIDWDELSKIFSLYYMESKICRLLVPSETMLRVHFLKLRYGMSESGIEEALFQIRVLRDFAKIDLFTDVIPNASCISAFQDLITKHSLEQTIDKAFNLTPMVES